MIVKPDRKTGRKPVYEDVKVDYYLNTNKIAFVNKHGASETGTLTEMKWVTKNMINLELVLGNNEYIQNKGDPK